MADKKEAPLPLLDGMLSTPERAMLQQMTLEGGYKVLIKLANEACKRANEDIAKLNPEDERYDQLLAERARRARYFSECCSLIFKSVDFHTEKMAVEQKEEEANSEDAVKKVYGVTVLRPVTK